MKKLLVLAAASLTVGFGACRTKCPAYSQLKPATQQATSVTASAESTAPARQ
ncbi:hypothetical protein [Hymenobacter koreensis]|uniref:hypothetical protein n=1 Tax=Hymenobacter koreensis TaxID=1084523 RepID=UPI0031EC2EEE